MNTKENEVQSELFLLSELSGGRVLYTQLYLITLTHRRYHSEFIHLTIDYHTIIIFRGRVEIQDCLIEDWSGDL